MKHLQKQWLCVIRLIFTIFILAIAFPAHSQNQVGLIDTVKQIEKRLGARIGFLVYDEGSGLNWQYHADDLFPMTSTFKTLACATLLSRVDAGQEKLDRVVTFEESNLVTYSPITKKRVGSAGMSLS